MKQLENIAEIELSYKPSIANKPIIASSYDAYLVLKEFYPKETINLQEYFIVAYLNRFNRVLGVLVLSKGGITGTLADIRLVFGTALKAAAEKDIKKAISSEINVLKSFSSCPNIIRLIGYCIAEGSLKDCCLVYEFAPLGDLLSLLLSSERRSELLWQYRLKIALGIATGLNYLHKHDRDQPAFHRDIKSANIVLMDDFTPKIIDCGLSKYVPQKGAGAAFGTTIFSTTLATCSPNALRRFSPGLK